ncbi:MAG: hypothetical protein KatS3mg111_0594 [Pirellulaceae bacterium]|nr:MAG: hypothetical protein KatS3mg111_0594 [Pirellulaceae bacterium]
METVDQSFVAIAVGVIVTALILFYLVSKYAPKGAVLGVAACLYVVSVSLPSFGYREVGLVWSVLRLASIAGIILGAIDAWKGSRGGVQSVAGEQKDATEIFEAEVIDTESEQEVNRAPSSNQ